MIARHLAVDFRTEQARSVALTHRRAQQSRDRAQSEQSRAREQAGSPCVGGEPAKSAGDMQKFNTGRSLTVAAQMGERAQSEPSRARKQAGSPCVGGEPEESAGDMRKFDAGRSLTVAALLRAAGGRGSEAGGWR